jgi:hypothetical protein
MNYVFYIGLLGVLAITLCWALAVVLFRVGPSGGVARKLAVLLVIEGIALLTAGFPEFLLNMEIVDAFYAANPWLGTVMGISHFLGDFGMIALYPPFLAIALGTALTRPFAKPIVRWIITIVAFAIFAGAIITRAMMDSMAGTTVLYFTVMITFFFALTASLQAWQTAKPGIARTRAGLFALAFGIRDVFWCFTYAASFWMSATGNFNPELDIFWITKIIYALGTLFAVPLIAYGILRAHLFDIDLKVRWTIKQSTLAAMIIAIIFLISEAANTFLSAELGTIGGLLGATVVIFLLTPLQRFAERVAASAMPNTENTPQYLAFRKMQVYEAAVVDAMSEDGISRKERALLAHLRESLGITVADAEMIERELAGDQPLPATA